MLEILVTMVYGAAILIILAALTYALVYVYILVTSYQEGYRDTSKYAEYIGYVTGFIALCMLCWLVGNIAAHVK